MHKIIAYGGIALTFIGAVGTNILISNRADAGPVTNQAPRVEIERLSPVGTVACGRHGRHDRDRYHCGPFRSGANQPTVRVDESGLPDSRRRFSRW